MVLTNVLYASFIISDRISLTIFFLPPHVHVLLTAPRSPVRDAPPGAPTVGHT